VCIGSPAVVLEAGYDDSAQAWRLADAHAPAVVHRVAGFTRVMRVCNRAETLVYTDPLDRGVTAQRPPDSVTIHNERYEPMTELSRRYRANCTSNANAGNAGSPTRPVHPGIQRRHIMVEYRERRVYCPDQASPEFGR